MVDNRIFVDLGMVLVPVYVSFWKPKFLKIFSFVKAVFQVIFLSISDSKYQRLGLPNQGFRMESIAKIGLSRFIISQSDALGAVFYFFEPRKQI